MVGRRTARSYRVRINRVVSDGDLALIRRWREDADAPAQLLERWLEPAATATAIATWPFPMRMQLCIDVLTVLIGRDARFAAAAAALTGHVVPPQTDLRVTAEHEAGHAIVANEFGLLREVSIHGDGDCAGACLHVTFNEHLASWPLRIFPRGYALRREVAKFIAIAYGGIAAETMIGGGYRKDAAADDFETAWGLALAARLVTLETLDEYLASQQRAARRILERRRHHFARVVDALLERGRLSAHDVRQLSAAAAH